MAQLEETMFPVLVLPKKCTNLETNCSFADNLYIHVNITSPDTEGNPTCIYTGFCNIKLIDVYGVNIKFSGAADTSATDIEIVMKGPQEEEPQVWLEPVSPQMYDGYDVTESRECYSVRHQSHTSITVEQHKTFITKNVFKEAVHFSAGEEFNQLEEQETRESELNNDLSYQDDSFDRGLFLTLLPEEIANEEQYRDRDDCKYIDLDSENGALKQLMSSDIQSTSKQKKTILYLGPDSQSGQTIQQIGYYDPKVECSGEPATAVDAEIAIEDTDPPRVKRYQCLQCRQIFEVFADYRAHLRSHAAGPRYNTRRRTHTEADYICADCGKTMKCRDKFEQHCLAHGNPDLECEKCGKVFASKFTLRVHKKIHERKHKCNYCPNRSYDKMDDLRGHITRSHGIYTCENCDYITKKHKDFLDHKSVHETLDVRDSSETELAESLSMFEDVLSDDDASDPDWRMKDSQAVKYEKIQDADSVIAKVMSNKMFLNGSGRRSKKCPKVCDVCYKSFDRMSDLKRHLIEHIVRSTLAKTPATSSGSLMLTCEICQVAVFSQVDKYKAHLREHAQLTQYKCTFCNKSFSDSSNFSKHKKTHGSPYFQCDLCQRKFNSKKMITQHIEHHNQTEPVACPHCDKTFHFTSMLNKHVRNIHTRQTLSKFRCRFCQDSFKTLKEKWDHEWMVHNVRKMIVDCLLCEAKFRKYADLKKHCIDVHKVHIPPARRLLKKKIRKARKLEEEEFSD